MRIRRREKLEQVFIEKLNEIIFGKIESMEKLNERIFEKIKVWKLISTYIKSYQLKNSCYKYLWKKNYQEAKNPREETQLKLQRIIINPPNMPNKKCATSMILNLFFSSVFLFLLLNLQKWMERVERTKVISLKNACFFRNGKDDERRVLVGGFIQGKGKQEQG